MAVKTLAAGMASACLIAFATMAHAAMDPATGPMRPLVPAGTAAHQPASGHLAGPVMRRRSILVGTSGHHKQWRERDDLMRRDVVALGACLDDESACTDAAIASWAGLVRQARAIPPAERLAYVNRRINALISYRFDHDGYGRRDYWASPSQTLGRSGDCEDYALAKYWTLRVLGFTPEKLRLVVLKNTRRKAYHAVLQVTDLGRDVLLDNLSDLPRRTGDLAHYRPLYSVNENWKWVHPAAVMPPALALLNTRIISRYGSS